MGLFGDIGKLGSGLVKTIGDFIPGVGDARSQEQANETNIQLSKENREWMERMSNTAYARAMADMKQSGLNPILAYQQGGASVPTSAAATVGAAPKTGLAHAAIQATTGIAGAYSQVQGAQTAQAQAQSSIGLQSAQSAQTIANTTKTQAETEKVKETIKSEKVRRELDRKKMNLEEVKSSAAGMAEKGVRTVEKMSNSMLRNVAKPRVDDKTLRYKPWYEDFFGTEETSAKPLIKGK